MIFFPSIVFVMIEHVMKKENVNRSFQIAFCGVIWTLAMSKQWRRMRGDKLNGKGV
jgi:hypothetical protein